MSTDTLPENGTQTHVSNDSGMGGTNAESEVREDGGTATGNEEAGQNAEGASPEAQEPEVEETPVSTEPQPSAAEFREMQERVQEADRLAALVMADPERMKTLREWQAKDSGQPTTSGLDAAYQAAEELFEPANKDALLKVLDPFKAKIEELERELTQMRPMVRQAHDMSQTGVFAQSLQKHGLNGDIFKNKDFLKHLGELRRNPNFQRDERTRPDYAAEFAAAKWKARSATRQANLGAREAVERAKNGRLHGASGLNGSGASKVVEIDDSRPGWTLAALKARQEAERSGSPVKIVYKSEK